MCVVCDAPGRRLHWDSYGAAVDDQGEFCSVECRRRWDRNDYDHQPSCQCVTCLFGVSADSATTEADAIDQVRRG